MSDQLAIGVDIGGTKIAFVLIDQSGAVRATHTLPALVEEGANAVFDRVASGVHHLIAQASAPISGIGIGCPGYVNPHTGVVKYASNLGWHDVHLLDEVRRRLDMDTPIWVQKDADAAVLGELYFGAGRGQSNFVHLTVGTGLGGGAVFNGELVLGAHFNAMEVGHIPFTPQGYVQADQRLRQCVCGMYGCPEIYCSGVGLLAAAREYLPDYPQSSLAGVSELSTQAILQAAAASDPLASRIMREAVESLANVVIAYIGFFDPALVSIGGGLGHAAPEHYIHALQKEVHRRHTVDLGFDIPIVQSQVASSATGAASLVWHYLR
jgi:glucokinase